tara:strand:- start:1 stop:513 length:513 start_codon:yes stop_codon:yes gene_type:complete
MDGEILQASGMVFFVKGDDVVPMMMSRTMMVDEANPKAINLEYGSGADAKKLIDDGYQLAFDDGSEEAKRVRSVVDNSNTMRGKEFSNLEINEGLGKKLFDGMKSIGGKFGRVLPALGILDIMGMKQEYDQIMAGEHPSGITSTVEKEAAKIYADGGYVTHPFVDDIFDN